MAVKLSSAQLSHAAKKVACYAAAAFAVLLAERARRRRVRPRGAPLVPGHWLLGNMPQIIQVAMKNQQLDWFHKLHVALGRTVCLKNPLEPWIVLTSCPKNVEHVLKLNFQNYPKGPAFQSKLFDLLGGGIFNADGEVWHRQRKVSSKMFTATLFKEHIWLVVRRNSRRLREILESTSPDKPVDVFNLMNRFTLDSIGEIGFGKCIGSLEDPSSPFLQSFDKAQQICFWRFFQPLWKLARFFGVSTENETQKHMGLLNAYTRDVVRELCDSMNDSTGKGGVSWADIEARKSFVGLFLEDAKKRGENLSEDYLRDLVLNFLIAGRDTTAQGLSWTLYCLTQNPDAEAKTRQEILDICGPNGPAYDDIPHLPYLHAVISEALRLFPSVPNDSKTALCDDTLPDGTFVPKGTEVVYDVYSMGRDQAIWGEDAEVFRPERWLERNEPPTNYEYPVFNAGPRECLGKRLAMVEMKACLATLLPTISFKLAVSSEEITPDTQLTIGMARGLPCFVEAAARVDRFYSNASTMLHSGSIGDVSESGHSEMTGVTSEDESGFVGCVRKTAHKTQPDMSQIVGKSALAPQQCRPGRQNKLQNKKRK